MKTNNSLVSVIMPVYNVEKHVGRAINSVLQQRDITSNCWSTIAMVGDYAVDDCKEDRYTNFSRIVTDFRTNKRQLCCNRLANQLIHFLEKYPQQNFRRRIMLGVSKVTITK